MPLFYESPCGCVCLGEPPEPEQDEHDPRKRHWRGLTVVHDCCSTPSEPRGFSLDRTCTDHGGNESPVQVGPVRERAILHDFVATYNRGEESRRCLLSLKHLMKGI